MFASNCSFLTCIKMSQEAGKVVCYSHLFENFLLFVVIHTVKGFVIVNKAEIDVFLELSCFMMIQWMFTTWSLVPLPFVNSVLTSEVLDSCTVEAWLGEFWALLCYHVKESESEVAQSCPTLCDPMDCSLPCSSVHGIFQARVLEWVTISLSRGSSRPRDRTWISRVVGRCCNLWATREALINFNQVIAFQLSS